MKKWQFILASTAMTTVLIAPIVEASTYTVEKGDTLSKIAVKHNTTIALLKEWNNLQSDSIYIDQKLIVSKKQQTSSNTNSQASSTVNPTVAIKPSATTAKIYTYVVVKGDNLTKIASKNNTTVAKIKQWNGLTSDKIYMDQTLIIRKEELASTGPIASLTESNSSGTTGNPSTGAPSPGISSADQEIAAQLAKEKKIQTAPSMTNLEKYKDAINLASSLIGTPYVYGGNSVDGFDCSGFVNYVYSNAGFSITRKSSLDYFMNDTTIVATPVPGDVVFFKNTYISTISHMGVYIGDNQFIHASSNGVEVSNLSYDYWDTRFVAFKRFNVVK
ncbi:MAG: LysM peptidoglycan-binding domain-containing protein [Lysinibacillus sp.]